MSIDQFLALASSHRQAGRLDLAERHYRQALGVSPGHRDACFGLAHTLVQASRFDEAIGYLQLLLHDGGDPCPVHQQLGLAETCAGRYARALEHFKQVLAHTPDEPAVLHVVANLQQALGLNDDAYASYRRALGLKPLVVVPAAISPPAFRVLLLFAPGAGNTPFQYLIENAPFESNVLTLLPNLDYDIAQHRAHADVVVNLVSDVDLSLALLEPAQAIADRLGLPLVNPPAQVAQTDREAIARRLAPLPGCVVPQTRRHRAAQLRAQLAEDADTPLPFPLLVRPAGTHGGDHFEKTDTPAQLQAFLDQHDAPDYYLTPFVDYRSDDGLYRKYRFLFVGDEMLPYHLAIGEHWKVHHATTRMAEHAWMQNEESGFLDQPWQVFDASQRAALEAIRETIGLDYFGIDCALARTGEVVVFEVNASMLVHGNNQQFPYKTPAVERIRQAFQTLLADRARTRPDHAAQAHVAPARHQLG
jgi:tetratricopeptide (TPR) repeat protein